MSPTGRSADDKESDFGGGQIRAVHPLEDGEDSPRRKKREHVTESGNQSLEGDSMSEDEELESEIDEL